MKGLSPEEIAEITGTLHSADIQPEKQIVILKYSFRISKKCKKNIFFDCNMKHISYICRQIVSILYRFLCKSGKVCNYGSSMFLIFLLTIKILILWQLI
jgi:hypothetical protein